MRRGSFTTVGLTWVVAASASLPACSVLNESDICEVTPDQYRVNQAGDQDEFVGSPSAAAAIGGGRLAIAYSAGPRESLDGFSVRYAFLRTSDGQREGLCGSGKPERTISSSGTPAFGGSVAAVDFSHPLFSNPAVAVITWLEGLGGDTTAFGQFLDGAGCPLLAKPVVLSSGVTGVRAAVVAAPSGDTAYAVLHDSRAIYRVPFIPGETPTPEEIHRSDQLTGFVSVASSPSGQSIAAWARITDSNTRRFRIEAALLTPEFELVQAQGSGAKFKKLFDRFAPVDSAVQPTLAATDDEFTVTVDGAAESGGSHSVTYQRFALSTLEAKTPLLQVAGGKQSSPTPLYTEAGVTIAYARRDGAVAATRGPSDNVVFNSVACDRSPFPVGSRTETFIGYANVLDVGGDIWIVHATSPAYDPIGTGVVAWRMPKTQLFPQLDR